MVNAIFVFLFLLSGNESPPLNLTARQLREFALPGVIHRLIVPVVRMEESRWTAGYGAIFAITVREGFIMIAVQGDG